MANLARMTGGLSPHAIFDAWSDWAMHLARAPGRQLDLMERAQTNAMKLGQHALARMTGHAPEKPFQPGDHDTRWTHEGWDSGPFALWQQGFLATQDWWEAATSDLRGLRGQNADRTGFVIRQLLDTVSPANFPALQPGDPRTDSGDRRAQPDRGRGAFRRMMPAISSPGNTAPCPRTSPLARCWPRRRARWSGATS